MNLLVGTVFASLLVDGSQDWLYYSDRLIEFPLGLFGVAIGTVILPHLSRRHAATDAEGYSAALDWGLRIALLAGVPAALGLLLLAGPITATIYNYGQFTAFDTRMAAISLTAMSVGIPAFMLSKVLSPAFYARQDTKTPMRAAIITVVANVLLIDAIRVEPDLQKRRAMVGEALRLLGDDLALVPLYRRTLTWVMRPNIDAVHWPNDVLELRWVRIR